MSLASFYLDQTPDHAGRHISDIWAFSLDDLEYHHDFIQWLFPLETSSAFNPDAPTLGPATIAQFRANPTVKENMLRSLDLMFHFYGLERITSPHLAIVRANNFAERSRNYLHPNNHNHLRLTRILHCLALCGLENEAAALLACLLDIAGDHPRSITETTLHFWRNAIRT